jgi:hypothetical protein
MDPQDPPKAEGRRKGLAARDEALERVSRGKTSYVSRGVEVGRMILDACGELTSEDIRRSLPIFDGEEPRVLGAVMNKLIRDEGLVRDRYEPTSRPEAHGRPIAVWKRGED